MTKQFLLFVAFGFLTNACDVKNKKSPATQPTQMGVLNVKTEFYDSNGNSIFLAPMKIWYHDSAVIEEIVRISSVTDTSNKTTVSFIPIVYRFIDLKYSSWYDYSSFTDTSRIIKSGILPDTVFPDHGWAFYAENLHMKGLPEVLPDTIISTTKYMRIKFSSLKSRSFDSYLIGYLRCDNKGKLFSLEKRFSNEVNCTMTRFYEYRDSAASPFASRILEFMSDTLSQKELNVFAAWSKNRR